MEQVTPVPDQSAVEQFTAAGLHPPLHPAFILGIRIRLSCG
ncbi:hypothetical protein ACGFJT_30900 [Actinomadura geliboluensis]